MKTAQAGEKEAKKLHAAGERVLTRVIGEKNKLQDANTSLGEELKDVRAQLGVGILEFVFLLPDPCPYTFAHGLLPFGSLFTRLCNF